VDIADSRPSKKVGNTDMSVLTTQQAHAKAK